MEMHLFITFWINGRVSRKNVLNLTDLHYLLALHKRIFKYNTGSTTDFQEDAFPLSIIKTFNNSVTELHKADNLYVELFDMR